MVLKGIVKIQNVSALQHKLYNAANESVFLDKPKLAYNQACIKPIYEKNQEMK